MEVGLRSVDVAFFGELAMLRESGDGEEVVADENGIYSVGKDCVVESRSREIH